MMSGKQIKGIVNSDSSDSDCIPVQHIQIHKSIHHLIQFNDFGYLHAEHVKTFFKGCQLKQSHRGIS